MEKDFFVGVGRLLKLYLVGDAVDGKVSALIEGNVVFRPSLPSALGHYLLEELAAVVLGVAKGFFEGFDRADDLGLAGEQEQLLHCVGLEAEGIACATACAVELRDIGEGVGVGVAGVNRALVGVAVDVLVGERAAGVLGDEGVVDGGVHRCGLLSFGMPYYTTADRICQYLFWYSDNIFCARDHYI